MRVGERYRRGGKNPHMRTTQKKPCSVCGTPAEHYSDGTISAHKVYEYKVVNGVNKRTTKWHYCSNKTWR